MEARDFYMMFVEPNVPCATLELLGLIHNTIHPTIGLNGYSEVVLISFGPVLMRATRTEQMYGSN